MSAVWKERDFERWFQAHPILPNGEPILLITRQRPIRRVVDLVGIDRDGALLIIEVKNEATSRHAIGQALEYLSHYEDISLPSLMEEFEEESEASLANAFESLFGRGLSELSPRRRVFLVGPSHDAYAAITADFLTRHLSSAGIHVEFAVATLVAGEFQLTTYRAAGLRRASDLSGGFGLSPRHQVFQIVSPGSQAVLWHIGKLDPATGKLRLRKTTSRRMVRLSQRLLMPCQAPAGVLTDQAGTVWQDRTRIGRRAKLVGTVNPESDIQKRSGTYVFLAVYDGGRFKRFQRMPLEHFEKRWHADAVPLPEWRQIAQHAHDLHMDRRKKRISKNPVA
jgi:hypothetical protein